MYFSMRTTRPQCMQAAQQYFDRHLMQFLQYLITSDGEGFGQLQQLLVTLPLKDGVLGVYPMQDT